MPRTLYHERDSESITWYPFPAYKPLKKGRYLVTYHRPSAGRWVGIHRWDGEIWERNADITAWMVLPERYGHGGRPRGRSDKHE